MRNISEYIAVDTVYGVLMRKLMIVLFVLIVVCVGVFALTACGGKPTELEMIMAKLSYCEQSVMMGSNDNYSVKYVSGVREKSFISDGKTTDVAPYATITLQPLGTAVIKDDITYNLIGDKGSVSGKLTKNILGGNYSHVIDISVDIGVVTSATFAIEKEEVVLELSDKLSGCIDYNKAIEYAYNNLTEELKGSFVDGAFDREVYVRLVNDRYSPAGGYYWYVSFMKDTMTHNSVLLNPQTGEVMNKK